MRISTQDDVSTWSGDAPRFSGKLPQTRCCSRNTSFIIQVTLSSLTNCDHRLLHVYFISCSLFFAIMCSDACRAAVCVCQCMSQDGKENCCFREAVSMLRKEMRIISVSPCWDLSKGLIISQLESWSKPDALPFVYYPDLWKNFYLRSKNFDPHSSNSFYAFELHHLF